MEAETTVKTEKGVVATEKTEIEKTTLETTGKGKIIMFKSNPLI